VITVKFDPSRINARLANVDRAVKESVREAAQAGAQAYYDELLMRVPQSPAGTAHIFTSRRRKDGSTGQKYLFYSGDLKRAIYQKYADDHSTASRAVYRISWRKGKAGGVPYGYMVEYGTSKMAPRPFLRPSYAAANQQAVQVARDTLHAAVQKALG